MTKRIRVLEFGDNIAAGYCGRLFALANAEVYRVDTRRSADEALDVYLHVDKQRMAINVRDGEGRELLSDLAAQCDVVITDVSPSELERLDWPTLGASNGGLTRVSITPFGLSGPYRDWAGFGPVLLAMGGYTALIGDPAREPLSLPGHYAEYQSGQYAYIAACAQLLADDGAPHSIEVSMLETVLSLSQFTTVMWTCAQVVRARYGNAWSNLHPIAMYPCKDGWFLVNVVPSFWPAFTRMLGREDLVDHPDFATNQARIANRDALDEIIRERLSGYSMAELMEIGQREFRVPTGGAMSFSDLLASDHLRQREFFRVVRIGDKVIDVPRAAFRFVGSEGNAPSEGIWQDAFAGGGNVETA